MKNATYIIILLAIFFSINAKGQKCPRYQQAINAGKKFLKEKNYDKALVEFQSAQLASRVCGLEKDSVADKFQEVFDGIIEQRKQATKDKNAALENAIKLTKSLQQEKKATIRAERLADLATSQAYASAAFVYSDKNPTVAINLALESISIHLNDMASAALMKAFNANSWFYSDEFKNVEDADMSLDGRKVLLVKKDRAILLSVKERTELSFPYKASNGQFLNNGNILLYSPIQFEKDGEVIIITQQGKLIAKHTIRFIRLSANQNNQILLVGMDTNHNSILYTINQTNGYLIKTPLNVEFELYNNIALANTEYTVITTGHTDKIFVQNNKTKSIISISKSTEFEPVSMDLLGNRVAIYLKSEFYGIDDAIGILDLSSTQKDKQITLFPFKHAEQEDGSGSVKFLDSTKVIANSTIGLSEILNIKTGEAIEIPGERAADEILLLPNFNLFALARRSGEIQVYDFSGKIISNLICNEPSDALNSAFYKLVTDQKNGQILSLSHDNVKIWQKPKYDLVVSGYSSILGDSINPSHSQYFDSFSPEKSYLNSPKVVKPRDITFINNSGEFIHTLKFGDLEENLRSGFFKDRNNGGVWTVRKIKNYGMSLHASKSHRRILIYDTNLILKIIIEEIKNGRFYKLDKDFVFRTVETKGFEGKVGVKGQTLPKLDPIPRDMINLINSKWR